MQLLPETLTLFDGIFLVFTSFFTSMLTAAVGIGGGVTLLAVMAQFMPAAAIVPVHGIVQMGSNVGRAALMRTDIDRTLLVYFLGGSLVGALIGGQIAVVLPAYYLQLLLGGFILYAVWGPKPIAAGSGTKGVALGGAFSTLLTMFVGATGPFVAAVLKPLQLGRVRQVATMSACMVLQHLLKVIVFGLLGFSFGPYVPLMAAMIALGFLGTIAGRHLLMRLPEAWFQRGLNLVLTLLAVRLVWTAGAALLAAA